MAYSKNKKMKNVEVDDLVVVNDIPDTVVYIVDSISDGANGKWAKLKYESGYKMVGGGEMPVSCLLKPTQEQLKNSGLN